MGKLSSEELKKLLGCIKKDQRVLVSPMPGYDSGVHRIDNKYLVVSTDPCTGVPEKWFGWLLINYAASDVALFGAKPEFCSLNLLAPLGTRPEIVHQAMKQACKAADELDIAIVTGHTGMYNSMTKLVGICTTYGTVQLEKLLTPGNAKPGDTILCVKPLGMETVVNFSITQKVLAQRLFGAKQTRKLLKSVSMQSCVREALQLAGTGKVHAMHDATEGGVVAAINELADASKVGFKIEWEKLPFCKESIILQQKFRLSDDQLLAMSSAGTILAAVDSKAKAEIMQMLSLNGFKHSLIGEFTESKKRSLIKNKIETPFPAVAEDPYIRILSGTV